MDSKKKTQILYDDPNSIFKAGKKIYLHELKGATLKSAKQFPDEIAGDLEGADLMESLIRDLSTLQNTLEMYYLVLFEGNNAEIFSGGLDGGIRDANKTIGYINILFKKLIKIRPDTFNEDDVYSLLGFYTDMMEKLQQIQQYGAMANIGLNTLFFRGIRFTTYLVKMGRMLEKLKVFIDTINASGAYPNISTQNVPSLFGPEPPPPPPVYPPEMADEMEGAGRFKVLSKRIRKQQVQPFKRFM